MRNRQIQPIKPQAKRQPKAEVITLELLVNEAQLVFDLLGDARLPAAQRQVAWRIYQRLERLGFIPDDNN